MTYCFRYRRFGFLPWRKIKKVVGHNLELDQDRMVMYLENGSIIGVGNWSKMTMALDTDWVLFTKSQMEEESGQDIKLKSGIAQ